MLCCAPRSMPLREALFSRALGQDAEGVAWITASSKPECLNLSLLGKCGSLPEQREKTAQGKTVQAFISRAVPRKAAILPLLCLQTSGYRWSIFSSARLSVPLIISHTCELLTFHGSSMPNWYRFARSLKTDDTDNPWFKKQESQRSIANAVSRLWGQRVLNSVKLRKTWFQKSELIWPWLIDPELAHFLALNCHPGVRGRYLGSVPATENISITFL